MKKVRGRPRKYDEDKVLEAAERVFWRKGFSATSLDDLAQSMAMNRPSIYRAFGDKKTIYRKVLQKFCQKMDLIYEQAMQGEGDIRQRLTCFYRGALAVYTDDVQAKGCLAMSTAIAAAASHPDIQNDILTVIQALDGKLTEQFELAIASGEIDATISAESRGALAQSLLHSLSLRARAGVEQGQLAKLIDGGVSIVTA